MELHNINLEGGEDRERSRAPLRSPSAPRATSIVNQQIGMISFFPCFPKIPKDAWWPKLLLFISLFFIGILSLFAMVSSVHYCADNGRCYDKCREKYYRQMVCGGRNFKVQGTFGECSCDCYCLTINKTLDKLDCNPDACILEGEVDEIPGRS